MTTRTKYQMELKEVIEKELPGYVENGYFSEDDLHDQLMNFIDEKAEENEINPNLYSSRSLADEYEFFLQTLMATSN